LAMHLLLTVGHGMRFSNKRSICYLRCFNLRSPCCSCSIFYHPRVAFHVTSPSIDTFFWFLLIYRLLLLASQCGLLFWPCRMSHVAHRWPSPIPHSACRDIPSTVGLGSLAIPISVNQTACNVICRDRCPSTKFPLAGFLTFALALVSSSVFAV
jgi:hypothetical protein